MRERRWTISLKEVIAFNRCSTVSISSRLEIPFKTSSIPPDAASIPSWTFVCAYNQTIMSPGETTLGKTAGKNTRKVHPLKQEHHIPRALVSREVSENLHIKVVQFILCSSKLQNSIETPHYVNVSDDIFIFVAIGEKDVVPRFWLSPNAYDQNW